VTCNLATAPPSLAAEYAMHYQANRNPTLVGVQAIVEGTGAYLSAVTPGQNAHLVATWTAKSIETFPVFDLTTQALRDDTETMTLTWFATSGTFATSHTGMSSTTTWENEWTADAIGPVHLWAVLRDSRGGVDFVSLP
jgi:hypothetical protein